MSQSRALTEIERFLSTASPEVLSISGLWGVGKTYAWDEALKAHRASTPLRQYAYVSVFGVRSLDALKTAIVQSTVSLDGNALEPTVDSFIEHVSSFSGIRKLGAEATRKGFGIFSRGAAALPYVGKMADLLAPGAALLIRNQIICIDDIERAGQGLDLADILGLVSSLRERRGCKVVLLLNKDGLGTETNTYQLYLEKVVEQAIKFEPSAQESAAAALDVTDRLSARLAECTINLGITNIRVIRRVRRFLSFIEPQLAGLHDGVTEAVVHSMALLGWCVFEPGIAPGIEQVRRFNPLSGLFSRDTRSMEEKRIDRSIEAYGFRYFDEVDEGLLMGLTSGAFNIVTLQAALKELDTKLMRNDVQAEIGKPWSIYGDSFANDTDDFLDALVVSVEQQGGAMTPLEASDALEFIRKLGRPDEADRLAQIYVDAQEGKPREFFAVSHVGYRRPIDPTIVTALERKLANIPLIRDPAKILLGIGRNKDWNPSDIAYLATVPVDDYRAIIKRLRGSDLSTAIWAALQFAQIQPVTSNELEVTKRMARALRLVAAESPINAMRVEPYLKGIGAFYENDMEKKADQEDS